MMKKYEVFTRAILIAVCFCFFRFSFSVQAAVKTWTGSDDGFWSIDVNWFDTGIPTLTDDVFVDYENVIVHAKKDFSAKSITVGGRYLSLLTFENFVFATIDPAGGDFAVKLRKGGKIIAQGQGVIILKGQLIFNYDEIVYHEPSFLFWAE